MVKRPREILLPFFESGSQVENEDLADSGVI
jgi:hypothetical protein